MGPQLLFNIASLQSLSAEETAVLDRYYFVVNAPVQFIDILRLPEADEIAKVAGKIRPFEEACWTVHYRILLSRALLSPKFRADEAHPEKEALRCWKSGQGDGAGTLSWFTKNSHQVLIFCTAEKSPAVFRFCLTKAAK